MKLAKLTGDLAARILSPVDLVPAARRLTAALSAAAPPKARHRVFVRTRSPEVEIGGVQGVATTAPAASTVRTAVATGEGIRRLAEREDVVALSPSSRLHPLLDLATSHIGVPPYRTRTGASGRGVLVGVVDTGIDTGHPALTSRVLRVWDQTATGGTPPAGFAYGDEMAGAAVGGAADPDGHGTHVASIAAGDDAAFPGVAPAAELIAVRTDFDAANIADAVTYVFGLADALDRPAVVNLSLGGHIDAHDGSDDLSAHIDQLTGPGRIVCAAAGNERQVAIHARLRVGAALTRSVGFEVVPGSAARAVFLGGWYPGLARLEVAVASPGGHSTPFQSAGGVARHRLPGAVVEISAPGPHPVNGDQNFAVTLWNPPSGPVPAGAWALLLRNPTAGAVRADVWSADDQYGIDARFLTAVHPGMKIGSPGAAAEAVTVASFTTKTAWVDEQGNGWSIANPLHDLSPFSNPGPLRSGARKPDLAVPGNRIVAARSSSSTPPPEERISAGHRILSGTSMATPVVTGIVALMLELDPGLDPVAIKKKLGGACAIPAGSSGGANDWGAGLLDCSLLP